MRVAALSLIASIVLTACATPTPTPVVRRLPTRARIATPTPTATPFAISGEAYYEQGLERQRAGDFSSAVRYFTWSIQRNPDFAPAYLSRALVHLADDDLDQALSDVEAALEIEPSARTYFVHGEVLRRMERPSQALAAFNDAIEADPNLRSGSFDARWAATRAAGDETKLSTLADEYTAANPDDAFRLYYQAWATLASDMPKEAAAQLTAGIEETVHPPALLWYVLGRAYHEMEAWDTAVASLETARSLVERGDVSLSLHTDRPAAELFVELGRAYLGVGRCADAETMLAHGISLGASMSEHLPVLQEAQACQKPTPETTP